MNPNRALISAIVMAAGVGVIAQAQSPATPDPKASTFAKPADDNTTLTAVEGIKVGHFTLAERPDYPAHLDVALRTTGLHELLRVGRVERDPAPHEG